ncbi:MAG TPA: hypothetical protein PL151_09915 [Phycisphaerae bacterium]|nr:hypothetical protein [Phycisphaerae bacterium]HOJ72854.1 hypothetical protein [Phycisphaerae bacterium]HOM51719.1 hypothetical protein [Phycisphaerae bacterium]HON68860.1 hypothetical protein [Phycisphaerae bacterium]HOQ86957.1 hypothetical protein [Phycisphaerae bacterium]
MDEVQAKVRQAQRRLWLNRWLSKLGWSATAGAVTFVLFVVFERMLLDLNDEAYVLWRVAGGLAGAVLLASLIWTFVTRESLAAAAARLDQAAHLKERLSTALHFAQSSDPFAQAAVADARHISTLVTPRAYLPVQVPRSAPYAGGSFVLALLFCWLFPVLDLSGKQAARQEEQIKQEQLERVKIEVKPVMDKLREIQKKHPELQKQTPQADPLEMAKMDNPADLKKNAIKEINASAARLEQKKGEAGLGKVEEFKQMLRKLAAQPTPTSMVSMLSKALAKGDFKAAQEALNTIRQELAKVPKSPEEKAKADQLRNDLKKLADQVGKIAESDSRLQEQVKQLNLSQEDAKKLMENLSQGKMDEAAKQLAEKGLSQEQIDKLMKQAAKSAEAKKEASKLAERLAKAAQKKGEKGGQGEEGKQSGQGDEQGEQGEQGDGSEGEGEGLSAAAEQLSELESLQQELAELSTALSDLQELKDQFTDGMDGGFGEGTANRPGPGMGNLGQGRGGVAPEQETAFKLTPQRTRVHTRSGAIIDQRFVEGEQYKGEVNEDFVEAVLGAREDLTEVARQKPQPRHIKLRQAEYFKRVEADLPKDKLDAARQKLEAAGGSEEK